MAGVGCVVVRFELAQEEEVAKYKMMGSSFVSTISIMVTHYRQICHFPNFCVIFLKISILSAFATCNLSFVVTFSFVVDVFVKDTLSRYCQLRDKA